LSHYSHLESRGASGFLENFWTPLPTHEYREEKRREEKREKREERREKIEEGRGKREEGRGKREEGRGKREERREEKRRREKREKRREEKRREKKEEIRERRERREERRKKREEKRREKRREKRKECPRSVVVKSPEVDTAWRYPTKPSCSNHSFSSGTVLPSPTSNTRTLPQNMADHSHTRPGSSLNNHLTSPR